MSYLISDYKYKLPKRLIANEPVQPRDHSRMLILDRVRPQLQHKNFLDFPEQLEKGSLLIVNNSKVIPARLPGQRVSGGKIEALLIREESEGVWQAKLKNLGRVKIGETLSFCENAIKGTLTNKYPDGSCSIKFVEAKNLFQLLKRHGYAPIPAYIRKARKDQPVERSQDLTTYQTVFAREYGAVAAPTAGLHFSKKILEAIKLRGIEIFSITLHVGPGTFEPVRVDDVRQHKMHREYYEISENVAKVITTAKNQGKKIVAVGTTTARTLESAWTNSKLLPGNSATDIFIYPPYQFKIVDQLLTNFHLPESTLMMLVSAFAGRKPIMDAYKAAIREKYRFYSYGDCMLLK